MFTVSMLSLLFMLAVAFALGVVLCGLLHQGEQTRHARQVAEADGLLREVLAHARIGHAVLIPLHLRSRIAEFIDRIRHG